MSNTKCAVCGGTMIALSNGVICERAISGNCRPQDHVTVQCSGCIEKDEKIRRLEHLLQQYQDDKKCNPAAESAKSEYDTFRECCELIIKKGGCGRQFCSECPFNDNKTRYYGCDMESTREVLKAAETWLAEHTAPIKPDVWKSEKFKESCQTIVDDGSCDDIYCHECPFGELCADADGAYVDPCNLQCGERVNAAEQWLAKHTQKEVSSCGSRHSCKQKDEAQETTFTKLKIEDWTPDGRPMVKCNPRDYAPGAVPFMDIHAYVYEKGDVTRYATIAPLFLGRGGELSVHAEDTLTILFPTSVLISTRP